MKHKQLAQADQGSHVTVAVETPHVAVAKQLQLGPPVSASLIGADEVQSHSFLQIRRL